MLELVTPSIVLRDAFLDAHHEWGPGLHEDGFGIRPSDDLETAGGFERWLDDITSSPGRLWWIVKDGRVLGGIAIRADDDLRAGAHGHIGYGVRSSARGQGVASWALAQVLARARADGRSEVAAVCRDDNLASIRTLEKCGGHLAGRLENGAARRYVFRLGWTS